MFLASIVPFMAAVPISVPSAKVPMSKFCVAILPNRVPVSNPFSIFSLALIILTSPAFVDSKPSVLKLRNFPFSAPLYFRVPRSNKVLGMAMPLIMDEISEPVLTKVLILNC